MRLARPTAAGILIAEYWPVNPAVVAPVGNGGAGFDATWNDKLRDSVRAAIGQASAGSGASVDLDSVAGAIQSFALPAQWRSVNCVENHDIVYRVCLTRSVSCDFDWIWSTLTH